MLSERRKGDRAKMAEEVVLLAREMNVQITRKPESETGPRLIWLDTVAAGGLRLTLDFDGESIQPDTFVMSWNMDFESEKRLNNATFGGNVNPHHKRKATYIAAGFDDLKMKLRQGWSMANDGSAYL